MKLYVIRHGQSLANEGGFYAGQRDYPLTELGRQQALEAGKLLERITFDAVYSSDLSRAADTARLALNCEPEQSALIREIDLGDLVGKTPDDCLAEYGDHFACGRANSDYTYFGGENRQQLTERLLQFIHTLEQSGHERVAVVAHAGLINAMRNYVLGGVVSHWSTSENAAINVFEYDGEQWTLRHWNVTKLS